MSHEKLLAVVRSGYTNTKGTLQRHTGTCSFMSKKIDCVYRLIALQHLKMFTSNKSCTQLVM